MVSALAFGTGTAIRANAGGINPGGQSIAAPVNPIMLTLELSDGAQASVSTARVTGQNSATQDGAQAIGARTS